MKEDKTNEHIYKNDYGNKENIIAHSDSNQINKIAVLIPCFNESKTVAKVIKDWKKALPEAVIYVYDNNSSDGTDVIAKNAGAIVRYEYQQGKGNVIRRMFREIDADCYVMVDGDDTYPANIANEMVEKVLKYDADMVIGDRLSSTYFKENKRPFHNIGNSITKLFINSIFNTDVKDIMTGLRAFSYQFVKTFPVLSEGFEIETEMTIHAVDKNMRIENVIVEYRDRPLGSQSKLNTIPDGIKVIKTIFNLFKNYKPLAFFGYIATILLTLAFLFFVPVLYEYFVTGLVERFPTLIVCGLVAIIGILCLFAGIILQTVIHKDRQQFEFRLQIAKEFYKSLKKKN